MVAAVNAGIDQGLFGLRPGEDFWPGAVVASSQADHVYRFEIEGIPGAASVRTDPWAELHIIAAFWPRGESLLRAECMARGWVERTQGPHLQQSSVRNSILFRCSRARLSSVAALVVEPKGYADRGRLRV